MTTQRPSTLAELEDALEDAYAEQDEAEESGDLETRLECATRVGLLEEGVARLRRSCMP